MPEGQYFDALAGEIGVVVEEIASSAQQDPADLVGASVRRQGPNSRLKRYDFEGALEVLHECQGCERAILAPPSRCSAYLACGPKRDLDEVPLLQALSAQLSK
jgi:hypothetical protein